MISQSSFARSQCIIASAGCGVLPARERHGGLDDEPAGPVATGFCVLLYSGGSFGLQAFANASAFG